MKTEIKSIAALLALVASVTQAQNYSIDWHTVDGGGGVSTGGVYSVSGTIGQPDAGRMSGGNFVLEGGFWGVIAAIQTPGAPFLSIFRTNGSVIVSWPLPATGWVLERTNLVSSTSPPWPQVPFPYVTNATDVRVTFPATPGNQFFRLHKP